MGWPEALGEDAMDRFRRGAGEFATEFEAGLLRLLGFYLLLATAAVSAVGGLWIAQHFWPRVVWVETVLVVVGIIVGGLAGMLAVQASHNRLSSGMKSRLLWFVLSLVPGAGLLIAVVELVTRFLHRWSGQTGDVAER